VIKNKDLTKKLLYKWKKSIGEIKEEDNFFESPSIYSQDKKKNLISTEHVVKLQEAQQILLEIKRKQPLLTEHLDHCFLQISQIIKLLER